jgi:hypothetical protein
MGFFSIRSIRHRGNPREKTVESIARERGFGRRKYEGRLALIDAGYLDRSRLTPHAYSRPHAAKLYRQNRLGELAKAR